MSVNTKPQRFDSYKLNMLSRLWDLARGNRSAYLRIRKQLTRHMLKRGYPHDTLKHVLTLKRQGARHLTVSLQFAHDLRVFYNALLDEYEREDMEKIEDVWELMDGSPKSDTLITDH